MTEQAEVVRAEIQHAEGQRYAVPLVLVPGLWAGPPVWRGFAGYLGHRGWESHVLQTCGLGGGLTARGRAVAEYAAGLPAPPVLIGHDAGAIAGLAAARRGPAAALVLLAPLVPGSRGARALALEPWRLVSLLLGRGIPPPRGRRAELAWGELPSAVRATVVRGLAAEDAATVWEVARGVPLPRPAGVPTLLVAGAVDPLLPVAAAAALAATVGAEHQVLDGAGHWPLAGDAWQQTVDRVHRWIVKRLGEPLLERYAEAMAEREPEEGGSGSR